MSQNPYAANYPSDMNQAPPRTSVLAIISLVLALLSPVGCCGTFFLFTKVGLSSMAIPSVLAAAASLAAIVALIRIKTSGGRKTGSGLAITGLVLGVIIGIIFAGLAVGMGIGLNWFANMVKLPTEVMTSSDPAKVRALVSPGLSAQITDADWARFQSEISAEIGTIQTLPSNPIALFKQYSEVGPMMQNQQQRNAMPVPLIGDKGKAVMWLHFPQGNSPGTNPPPGANLGELFLSLTENMSVLLPSGKEVWLIDPGMLPAPANNRNTPRSLPTPPTSPTPAPTP